VESPPVSPRVGDAGVFGVSCSLFHSCVFLYFPEIQTPFNSEFIITSLLMHLYIYNSMVKP
jgi:hypothetical protein